MDHPACPHRFISRTSFKLKDRNQVCLQAWPIFEKPPDGVTVLKCSNTCRFTQEYRPPFYKDHQNKRQMFLAAHKGKDLSSQWRNIGIPYWKYSSLFWNLAKWRRLRCYIFKKKPQKFFIKKEDIVLSNSQMISFGFTQCNVCPQGVMNRQDTYPPTKYSDPEFQQSPSLFNKSTWIAAAEDSVSCKQETSCHHHHDRPGAQHLDVSILDLQLADSSTHLCFINFTVSVISTQNMSCHDWLFQISPQQPKQINVREINVLPSGI